MITRHWRALTDDPSEILHRAPRALAVAQPSGALSGLLPKMLKTCRHRLFRSRARLAMRCERKAWASAVAAAEAVCGCRGAFSRPPCHLICELVEVAASCPA